MDQMKKNKMAVKPMTPLLLGMAFPPMVSMLIQSLYNIVDSMFVAQISESALTAVSLAFPVQSLVVSASVGIGVGVNSYIARKLGEGNPEKAGSAAVHGMVLAAIASVLTAILGIFGTRGFLRMFTQDLAILDMAESYMYIVVFFSFTSYYYILIEKIFQATGKMTIPMIVQAVGALTNIILDPIMIFGWFGFPQLGVRGAAIATVTAQFLSMLLAFFFLRKCRHELKLNFIQFKLEKRVLREILNVGIPSTCMNALSSFLVMGLNSVLIQFSNTAVSLFGVYYKLQTFVFMPVSGLTQGAMPIMGYNYGAKDRRRLLSCLKTSLLIAFIIMCIGVILFQSFPKKLLFLFHASEEMTGMGVTALRILSLSYFPAVLGFIFPTLFQAMGRGKESLVVFLLRQFCITLPLSWLLSKFYGLNGIWFSFLIAETVASVVALWFFARIYRTVLEKN